MKIHSNEYKTQYIKEIIELLATDPWINAQEIANKLQIRESSKRINLKNAVRIETCTGPEKILNVMRNLYTNLQIDFFRYQANSVLFSEFNKFGRNLRNIYGLYKWHIERTIHYQNYLKTLSMSPANNECNLLYFDKLYPFFTDQEKELCHHIYILNLPYSEREQVAKSGINFYEKYADEARMKLASIKLQ